MFEVGWSELLVIGVVALIVVGPKDLPGLFRTFGQYMNKARSMARDFQRNMEQAARDAGMEDVTKAAHSVRDVGRLATGGMSGLAQFGLDHTKSFATSAAAKPAVPPAEPEPAPAPVPVVTAAPPVPSADPEPPKVPV